ncbi:hypothetical protein [Sinisalibacter aestuarii]|uniref:hypothetical protein n=1 Tax=Sinisalibacter aestuarii TaxID=2949426 RepID=UPI0024936652|nr:hypothetical protein [Sinisalibacter aestuarii]
MRLELFGMLSLYEKMEIQLGDLRTLRAGHRGDLQVGVLPFEVKKYSRVSRDTVVLSTQSVRHILAQHGDHIALETLLLLPSVLQQGLWISDRKMAFVVVYQDDVSGVRYKVALKMTADQSRSYVRTMHKMQHRQTRSVLKRGDLVRRHWMR